MSIHLVSNGTRSLEHYSHIAKQVDSYVDYFHLREKQLTARELYNGALLLIKTGIQPEKIIINDRIDVAMALGVGVHLAYHSLPIHEVSRTFPSIQISSSTHSLEEAREKANAGARFLFFGHIYQTSSKPGLNPRGCKKLQNVCQHVTKPVIAIGGITPENVGEVLEHGAAGVAVMSGILNHHNPQASAKQYHLAIKTWKGGHHEKTV
ncbi:thiamine phosphate synthase [Bacillus salitolerans]|uniref:Thiamine phosphate synthase n=1 Tax=Bacillus salitolerans TaxID=1437434 RepID=A0ABW4LV80_9BACI